MSTTTVPDEHDNVIPAADDVEPGHLFTPDQQAERAAEFRARCPQVILSPAQRRRAGREQRRYLRQALTREAAERARSAATALAALRPSPGSTPSWPTLPPGSFGHQQRRRGGAGVVAVAAPVRSLGAAVTVSGIPAGLNVVRCAVGCCWYVVHDGSGIVVVTCATQARAMAVARSLAGIADWSWPGAGLFRPVRIGAAVHRLHEAQHRAVA